MSPANNPYSVSEYLQQAAHNLSLATEIRNNKSEYLDWAATCLFYAAVHYLNAYFVKLNIDIPRRHTTSDPNKPGRTDIVRQDPILSSTIYSPYRHLIDESRDARHELMKISVADYDGFLLPQLEKIRRFVTPKVTN